MAKNEVYKRGAKRDLSEDWQLFRKHCPALKLAELNFDSLGATLTLAVNAKKSAKYFSAVSGAFLQSNHTDAARQLLEFEKEDPQTFGYSGWVADAQRRLLIPVAHTTETEKAACRYVRDRFNWLRKRQQKEPRWLQLYDLVICTEDEVQLNISTLNLSDRENSKVETNIPHSKHWGAVIRFARKTLESSTQPDTASIVKRYWQSKERSCSCLNKSKVTQLIAATLENPTFSESRLMTIAKANIADVSESTFNHFRARLYGKRANQAQHS